MATTTVSGLQFFIRLALEEGLSAHELCDVVWKEMRIHDKRLKRERQAAATLRLVQPQVASTRDGAVDEVRPLSAA